MIRDVQRKRPPTNGKNGANQVLASIPVENPSGLKPGSNNHTIPWTVNRSSTEHITSRNHTCHKVLNMSDMEVDLTFSLCMLSLPVIRPHFPDMSAHVESRTQNSSCLSQETNGLSQATDASQLGRAFTSDGEITESFLLQLSKSSSLQVDRS